MPNRSPLLFDSHVHLDRLAAPEQEAREAREKGVGGFLVPGIDPANWPELLSTVELIPEAVAALGIHPLKGHLWSPEYLERLESLLQHPKVIAIGEVGLDRQAELPLSQQEGLLRHQIRLAIRQHKPLLLHNRGTTGQLMTLLREGGAEQVGGIFHAFSGSLETAREAIRLGFLIGVGGAITWPEASRLCKMVAQLPSEALVLESDAPDMTPSPYRGTPNRPSYLPLVANRLATLRGCSVAEIAHSTRENLSRLFPQFASTSLWRSELPHD